MAKYVTKQREKLLACLTEQADKQITARQIAEILTADKISISAVYRNLAALEEEGILKRIVREGTREVYYQFIDTEECRNSLHLSCKICGKIIHMKLEDTEQLILNTLKNTGFQIDKSESTLYGVCKDCRKQKIMTDTCNITTKKRILAIFVIVVILFEIFYSSFYVATQATHDCVGENCKICHQINIFRNTAKSPPTAVFTEIFCAVSLFFLWKWILPPIDCFQNSTLVSLKVKLSN